MVAPSVSERPPYATFETRSLEDRNASQEAGHYVGRDVVFIILTPAGSKDRIERVASEWFDQKALDVRSGRFPAEWLAAYRAAFDAYVKDEEVPLNGTSLANWPALSPSMFMTLKAANIRTIEDLAVANESSLQRIGMGARTLKQRAIDYLSAAGGHGKLEAEMGELRSQNERLAQTNEQLQTQLRELAARLDVGPDTGKATIDPGTKL